MLPDDRRAKAPARRFRPVDEGEHTMSRRIRMPVLGIVLSLLWCGLAASASPKSEIKGAAILDHPCGKVSVRQMGFVHAGRFDDANLLSTAEMQGKWKAMPAKDREMMTGMMKEMSQTDEQYAKDVAAGGVLAVDRQSATLTVQKKQQDANGSSTSTMTQNFRIDGDQCLVSR